MNRNRKISFGELYGKFGIYVILIIEMVIFSIMSPAFLTPSNLVNIGRQISFVGISAIGVAIVVIVGAIDISTGSILAFSGVLCSMLTVNLGLPVFPAIILTLLLSAVLGLFTGFVVTKLKVVALIATLGMTTIVKGISYLLTGAVAVYGLPEGMLNLGQGYLFGVLPYPLVIMCVLYVLASWFMGKSYFGRRYYAIGGNKEAARLSGIKINKYIISTFIISGVLTGLAGILMAGRMGSGQPSVGSEHAMDVLTAAVLGGVDISGGKGNIWGVFVGALFMGALTNGLQLCNVNEYWQWVFKGFVFLGAVALSNLTRKSD